MENANQEQTIVGAIYKIKMDLKDGVTPKNGMTFRPKFFVIVGTAEYGYYVAYILVNKDINEKFIDSKELLDCQFPLKMKDYKGIFKIDPSYANLSKIREMEKERLLKEAVYQGHLTESDLTLIMQSIEKSNVITTAEKRRYGIIK